MNLILFVAALASAALATKFSIVLAERGQLFDQPGELKVHTKPTSRLGGTGVMAGLSFGLAAAWALGIGPNSSLAVPLAVLTTVWLLGLADDIWNMYPVLRLAIQLVAGSALWLSGWRLQLIDSPLLDLTLTALLFAFFVNSMNFLDGMDGLALGSAAIYFGAFLGIARPGSTTFVVATFALAGALGALPLNLPPAKTFIGDSGSNLLGALMCFLLLDWSRGNSGTHTPFLGLLLAAIPLLDAAFAIARRMSAGRSPMVGDRSHYYDLLLRRKWPVARVLFLSYVATAGIAGLAWLCASGFLRVAETCVLVVACLSTAAYFLGSFATQRRSPATNRNAARLSQDQSAQV